MAALIIIDDAGFAGNVSNVNDADLVGNVSDENSNYSFVEVKDPTRQEYIKKQMQQIFTEQVPDMPSNVADICIEYAKEAQTMKIAVLKWKRDICCPWDIIHPWG